MGGYDPYSSSKGCAELVASSYRRSFLQEQGIGLASVRAGNVIGGGDWAKDRLLPDILRAFETGQPVIVRNPHTTRPWQHVLEPLSGYLRLAEQMFNDPVTFSEGWNFGPYYYDVKSVDWILDHMIELWPGASWVLNENENPHEATLLNLDISKASRLLGWTPTWGLPMTLGSIIRWHKLWLSGAEMQKVCITEIDNFTKDMN